MKTLLPASLVLLTLTSTSVLAQDEELETVPALVSQSLTEADAVTPPTPPAPVDETDADSATTTSDFLRGVSSADPVDEADAAPVSAAPAVALTAADTLTAAPAVTGGADAPPPPAPADEVDPQPSPLQDANPNSSGLANTGPISPGRAATFAGTDPVTPVTGDPTTVSPAIHLPAGTFSRTLGARFAVEQFNMSQFGTFTGVRITSEPLSGSPLRQLNLGLGDIITRLDGAPVLHLQELEIHVRDTRVRYIKFETETVRIGQIYIDEFYFFSEPGQAANAQPVDSQLQTPVLLP